MLTKKSVKKRIAEIPGGARSARDEVEIVRGYVADWRRYRRFSGRAEVDDYSVCARVVMDSHRIEKRTGTSDTAQLVRSRCARAAFGGGGRTAQQRGQPCCPCQEHGVGCGRRLLRIFRRCFRTGA